MLGRRRRERCRPASYAQDNDEEGLTKLSTKLTGDLRRHVRELSYAAPLTDIWNIQLPHIKRIAAVADLESSLPKTEANATLWEGEELALRFLLEDGKMNLVLRMLHEAKLEQIGMRTNGGASLAFGAESKDAGDGVVTSSKQAVADNVEGKVNSNNSVDTDETKKKETGKDGAAADGGIAKVAIADSLNDFEESSGRLLNHAWEHIEAVQTTDMPLLCSHLTYVLRAALETSTENSASTSDDRKEEEVCFNKWSQEALLLHTFAILMRAVQDGLEEDRCLPWVRKERCVSAVVHHLATNHHRIGQDDIVQGLAALSALFGTEDYSVFENKYIASDEDRVALVALQDLVSDVSSQGAEEKRALRRLADEISATKRGARK